MVMMQIGIMMMRQSNPFHSSRQGQLGSNWNCSETLKLPKIALKEPLLFLSAHSCHGDGDCYDDDNENDENYDDWTGWRATEEDMHQCTQPPHAILVNSDDDHTWYTYKFWWYLIIHWTKYQIQNNTKTHKYSTCRTPLEAGPLPPLPPPPPLQRVNPSWQWLQMIGQHLSIIYQIDTTKR